MSELLTHKLSDRPNWWVPRVFMWGAVVLAGVMCRSSRTPPFTPMKIGVHHQVSRLGRWIPIFIGMIGVAGCSDTTKSELIFNCGSKDEVATGEYSRAYVINLKNQTAKFVTSDVINGSADINDDIIKMEFAVKNDEASWTIKFILNRYTGNATHEHGSAPFGQFSPENVYYEMQCVSAQERQI